MISFAKGLPRVRAERRLVTSRVVGGAMSENEPISDVTRVYDDYDWDTVKSFWSSIISADRPLPDFIKGNTTFGIPNIQQLTEMGELSGEFSSNEPRFNDKKTYAIRIGYNGCYYEYGFQRQRVKYPEIEVQTVELDIKEALGLNCQITTAGRTDKYVSAVSQVVTIVTSVDVTPAEILRRGRESKAARSGRLVFYDCARAPRAFNARSSATWRRYLYLVPLENTSEHVGNVDPTAVNRILGHLEGHELPYNAFAFGEQRDKGHGLEDKCTMYLSRAYEVAIPLYAEDGTQENDAVGMARALCIELVGTRFLRRMVRLLVATAVEEAQKSEEVRDEGVLKAICLSGDRSLRARPFPGLGLAFAGCGFDYRSMAYYKFISKVKRAMLDEEFRRRDEDATAQQ